MNEPRATSLGDRWRREVTRGIDEKRLQMALQTLPSIRQPMVRIVVGAITAEFEGAMGSIHEVSIRVPPLPTRIWDQLVPVLRRSAKMLEALQEGRVPLAFDRLVARIGGESALPESRRISHACTCGLAESPCRHVLALHELFARRLDERPWLLLQLRGGNVRTLLEKVAEASRADLPPLAFGTREEPVLFPEAGDGDLDNALTREQTHSLLGTSAAAIYPAVDAMLRALEEPPQDPAAAGASAGEPEPETSPR
ncbi:MAG TPA: hypothetical protein VK081_13750, partial [Planctomycetota bacterium]|nr:hypothetical protein [Planctomycetota bacterium]